MFISEKIRKSIQAQPVSARKAIRAWIAWAERFQREEGLEVDAHSEARNEWSNMGYDIIQRHPGSKSLVVKIARMQGLGEF